MASFSEPFTGTNGTTPSGWTNLSNAITISSNQARGSVSDICAASYTGVQFGMNQYAKAVVKAFGGGLVGVGVRARASGTSGYWVYADGSSVVVHADAGDYTPLATITQSVVANDVIELRVVGTTLRVYLNGTQIGTDLDADAIQTGYGAIQISYSTTARMDDFETGDLNADWSYNAGAAVVNNADMYPGLRDRRGRRRGHGGPLGVVRPSEPSVRDVQSHRHVYDFKDRHGGRACDAATSSGGWRVVRRRQWQSRVQMRPLN